MVERHPDAATLRRLLTGELEPVAVGQVLRHLTDGCKHCALAIQKLCSSGDLVPGDRPGSWRANGQPSTYEEALDRAFRRAREASSRLESERAQAARLVPELLVHPLRRQLWMVRNSRLYATWAVCEQLLEEAWGLRFDDPNRAGEITELAVAVAEELDPGHQGRALVSDLRARAWAALANSRRVLSDFQFAEEAFRVAEEHLETGSGNPLDRAWILDLRASLLSGLARYHEAECLLDEALEVYRQSEQLHALGRALIKKGMLRGYLGDHDGEIALIRSGLELVDAESDPQLVVGAWQNLICSLHEKGDNREALALLVRARPMYLATAHRMTLLRFQWLEGTIAMALGRHEQAEGCLREVRCSFVEEGITVDAALATLDLAGLYADQGRYSEVKKLAAEMLAVFRSRQIATPAITAMLLFQRAAQSERVTAALLKRVADAVRKAGVGSANGKPGTPRIAGPRT